MLSLFMFQEQPQPGEAPGFCFCRNRLLPQHPIGQVGRKGIQPEQRDQIKQRRPDQKAEPIKHRVKRHGKRCKPAGRNSKYHGCCDSPSVIRKVKQDHQNGVAHGVKTVPYTQGAEVAVHQVVEPKRQQSQQSVLQ